MEIQKIGDLSRWRHHDGKALVFLSHKVRNIRIDFRADAPVSIHVHADASGEVVEQFLTRLPSGMSSVEFTAGGGTLHFDSTGDFAYWSPELETVSFENIDDETFTSIAARRERNPQVEMMEFIMNQNISRRMSAMDAEFERRIAAMEERGNIEDARALSNTGRPSERVHQRAAEERQELENEGPDGGADADADGAALADGRGRAAKPAVPVGGKAVSSKGGKP